MQLYASDPRDHSICDLRWYFSRDQFVLAILSPARYDVITFVELVEQSANIGRVVLKVGIHWDQDLAPRGVYPRRHRCSLAIISSKGNHPNPTILCRDLFQYVE